MPIEQRAQTSTQANGSRLRRLAAKQGYALCRSRRAESVDNLQGWMIVDPYRNWVVAGEKFDMTDEDVERFLSE